MPIFRISGKLVYFSHVPKCAGTAIEFYLKDAFGPLAFQDARFAALPASRRWTRSSPQHIAAEDLERLFPADFFDETFTVVRSPVPRLVSAFRFQRDIEEAIEPDMPFGDWLDMVHSSRRRKRWQFDNHARPMAEIVPPGAKVFRLEDGLASLVVWLRQLAGEKVVLDNQIKPRNVLANRLRFEKKPDRPINPTPDERASVARYYAIDYERFRYDPLTGDPL